MWWSPVFNFCSQCCLLRSLYISLMLLKIDVLSVIIINSFFSCLWIGFLSFRSLGEQKKKDPKKKVELSIGRETNKLLSLNKYNWLLIILINFLFAGILICSKNFDLIESLVEQQLAVGGFCNCGQMKCNFIILWKIIDDILSLYLFIYFFPFIFFPLLLFMKILWWEIIIQHYLRKKKINREIKIIKSSTLLYIIKYTFFLHLFVSNRSRRIN